jgi:8-oxo-dGTP pyrophosphatase MutT (NUDIX family)
VKKVWTLFRPFFLVELFIPYSGIVNGPLELQKYSFREPRKINESLSAWMKVPGKQREFNSILELLRHLLQNTLPGMEGQLPMAPLPIERERFALGEKGDTRKGAVLFLLYPEGKNCLLPFIKRPVYDGVHSGQIGLPGGKFEEGDADLQATALRETGEELGVNPNDIKVLGGLSKLYIPPSNFTVHPYLGYVNYTPEFTPDPREVDRLIVCDFKELMDQAIRKQKEIELANGQIIQAPYFDIHGEVLWGATAMMLSELVFLWEKYDASTISQ